MLNALIFDVDGTLADTEGVHRDAFNAAFREAGFDWHWSEAMYASLLEVSGGKERIRHYWQLVDPAGAAAPGAGAAIDDLHALKTRHYDRLAGEGQLALRPGILRLIREAQAARLPLAIATTTTPANIDALLRTPLGSGWRDMFGGRLRRRHGGKSRSRRRTYTTPRWRRYPCRQATAWPSRTPPTACVPRARQAYRRW
jgi:beta-phosphoglucomutase-like phosphatase (HAD superfamily)